MAIEVWSVINYWILFGCIWGVAIGTGGTRNDQKNTNRRRDEPDSQSIPPTPDCYKRIDYSSFSGTNSFRTKKNNDSPQTCADLCSKIHDDQDETRTCRAFDSNVRTGVCRFYEKNRQDENVRLIDSTKTHVYELDETCLRAKNGPPTLAPRISTCKIGTKPLMERVSGFYLKASGLAFKQIQEKDCVKECLKDELPDRKENYKCSSVAYNSVNQACIYLNAIARPLNKYGPPLTPDSRYQYYAKMCLPIDAVAKCPGFITRFVGKQLVAMSDAKVTTINYGECVKACLMAETNLGFVCRSGMFYNKLSTDNCILNYADHYNEHTLFVDEQTEVDYFSVRSCQW